VYERSAIHGMMAISQRLVSFFVFKRLMDIIYYIIMFPWNTVLVLMLNRNERWLVPWGHIKIIILKGFPIVIFLNFYKNISFVELLLWFRVKYFYLRRAIILSTDGPIYSLATVLSANRTYNNITRLLARFFFFFWHLSPNSVKIFGATIISW
jgi:hypothetical protein